MVVQHTTLETYDDCLHWRRRGPWIQAGLDASYTLSQITGNSSTPMKDAQPSIVDQSANHLFWLGKHDWGVAVVPFRR